MKERSKGKRNVEYLKQKETFTLDKKTILASLMNALDEVRATLGFWFSFLFFIVE
jgi:hypothetical protein